MLPWGGVHVKRYSSIVLYSTWWKYYLCGPVDTVMRDGRNVYVGQSKRLCDTVEKFMLDSRNDYVGKEKCS